MKDASCPVMPLRFECPHCSSRLSAGKELYHTVFDCPDCHEKFMVPAPQDIKLPTDSIKFVCPHCRRKLSATPEQFGTEMPCPFVNCALPIQVPSQEWKSLGDSLA
jgi:DNA-directed RNA polymerase subunit RPC12/RpoP